MIKDRLLHGISGMILTWKNKIEIVTSGTMNNNTP